MGGDCMDYSEFLRQSMEKNKKEAQELILKERQNKINELIKRSGIPKRFKNSTFLNYDQSENREASWKVIEFANEFPNNKRGLLLTGNVGTGKTHLAVALANKLLDNLYSVYFGNVIDVLGFIKSTYSQNSKITEDEAINLMTKEVDLFIIDDLGKENSTEYTLAMLYQLINRVYENDKTLVITTNDNSDNLVKNLGNRGQAIVSRITEMCEPVVFKGRDWRLHSGKGNY